MTALMLQYALSLQQAGNLREAEAICTAILRNDPHNIEALYLLGTLHLQVGKFAESERLLVEVPKSNPHFAEALYYRGIALGKLRRHADVVTCFDELLLIRPDFVPALWERGAALSRLERYQEALECYDRFLAIQTNSSEGWHMRGNALAGLGRLSDALASYDRSLAINSDGIETMHRRADALFHLNRFQEASDQYEHLLALDPHALYVRGRLVFDKLHRCDWSRVREHQSQIVKDLSAGRPVVSPGEYMAFSHSPRDQLQCARIWTASQCPPAVDSPWREERYQHDRIRVAYLSKDFRFHPVTAQLVGVIESHDKARFETIGISFGPNDQTEMCARLMAGFEKFAVVQNRSDIEVAAFLRQYEVDIAIDLMGHTVGSRPGIFALRPAPVQVSYLGFPGTMGADYIDYILADPIIIPQSDREFYSERVVYLPDTYFPTDSNRHVAERTPTRAEAGMPDSGLVFCSFNNSFKYSPEIFNVWMKLLREIENSVLWLPKASDAAIGNLCREAEARGVRSDRLIFAPFVPNPADHLARLRLADLFLDTLPYNAHSSACDALWAGIPVVTCRGTTFAGRVASSILRAIGLPELVTHSLVEYEAAAIALARDPAMLSGLKSKLASNRASCPLFDTKRLTRHLEAAFATMWQRHQRGESPANFAVEPQS